MRELLAEEMRLVAGGLKPLPPITLRGFTVRPPRPANQTLAYHPPSTGGEQHHGGGGGGGRVHVGVSSGGLSSQALAGISRIKDQLGVDLTAYAQMSPTLAQEIANATATWDMSFAYDPKGSYLKWDDQVKGTIYINSEYKNNINDFVKGMSHELGHVDHRAADNASKVTSQQYVNEKLLSEGFATLSNERVQHEIYAASGGTIDIGISGNVANRASYDGEYTRYANRQATMLQAASAMSVKYGELERVADGRTYGKYYLDDYYSQGGKW